MADAHASGPRVGVGVLVLDDAGRMLLALRLREPEAGCWGLPGGKVEPMEALADAAIREVREETGLEVRLGRLLCVAELRQPELGQHWVSPAYLARIVGGHLAHAERAATGAPQFFARDALPAPLTESARRALEALALGGAAPDAG